MSRNSGKTVFCIDKCVIRCCNDTRNMLFMMKKDNKVEKGVFQGLKNSLSKLKIYDEVKINNTNRTVTFPNGSIITCLGLQDSERIKGFTDVTDVLLDECTSFTVEDIEKIDGTLRGKAKQKQIYFCFNPISKQNWVYSFFGFDTGIVPDKTYILKSTWKDNKFLQQEEIDRLLALKNRNPALYKIECEGDFATLDKLIYTYTMEEFDYRQLLRNKTDDIYAIFGLDFGYVNDSTALICSVVDNTNKKLYIFDEYFRKGMLNSDIAQMIKDKGYSKEIIVADSAEQKSIAELKKLGIIRIIGAKKGHNSIIAGINKVKEYDLVVHPNCIYIRDELDNYCWKKDSMTDEYINVPIDTFNHGLDALRYSMQSVKKKARILTVGI